MKLYIVVCVVLAAVSESGCDVAKEPPRNATEEAAKTDAAPKKIKVDLGGNVNMEMTFIPAGEFMMGSSESAEATASFFKTKYGYRFLEADLFNNEHPQHLVRITKPFYLGTYHVTRGQFRQFIVDTGYKTDAEKGNRPGASGWDFDTGVPNENAKNSWRNVGFEQTDEHPVVCMSWNDSARVLQMVEQAARKGYTGFRRKRNGNMPVAAPARQPGFIVAMILRPWPRWATCPTPPSRQNSLIGPRRSRRAMATLSTSPVGKFKLRKCLWVV